MSSLTFLLILLSGIYVGMFLFIYLYQDKLIFFPPSPNPLHYEQWKQNELYIPSKKDKLHAWKVTNQKCTNNYSLIYFGGNAEDVSGNLPDAANYNVKNIYFINLSGYGSSTGKPSESVFYQNGLDVYDYIVNQENTKPDTIILMGRSLGSAVALYVNANRKVKALLLVTPFDKLSNLVPGLLKYLFPTTLTLKHKFDNLSYIESIKNKILILAASHDEVIPTKSTMTLHKTCDVNAKCTVIDDTNHQTISNEIYFEEINEFIAAL